MSLPLLAACPGRAGPTVVFSALDDIHASVDVYGISGDGEVVSLTDDGKSSGPAFSPDGSSLVFARSATRAGAAGGPPPATSLWTMDTDGGNVRPLIELVEAGTPSYSPEVSQGGLFHLSWSPAGDQLFFAQSSHDKPDLVAVSLDVATGELTSVADRVVSVGYSTGDTGGITYLRATGEEGQLQLLDTADPLAEPVPLHGPVVLPASRIAVSPCTSTT